MPEKEKINYGVRPLKKNERRPTQQEALKAKAVRYYGKHKLNIDILKEYLNKKNVKKEKTENDLVFEMRKYYWKMEALAEKYMSKNISQKEKDKFKSQIKNAYTRFYNIRKTINENKNVETTPKKSPDELIKTLENIIIKRREEKRNRLVNA